MRPPDPPREPDQEPTDERAPWFNWGLKAAAGDASLTDPARQADIGLTKPAPGRAEWDVLGRGTWNLNSLSQELGDFLADHVRHFPEHVVAVTSECDMLGLWQDVLEMSLTIGAE